MMKETRGGGTRCGIGVGGCAVRVVLGDMRKGIKVGGRFWVLYRSRYWPAAKRSAGARHKARRALPLPRATRSVQVYCQAQG